MEVKWWEKCEELIKSLFKKAEKEEEEEEVQSSMKYGRMGKWFFVLLMIGQSLVG